MGQSAATPSTTFNPVPHLIGIGALSAANPLIYSSAEPIAAWLLPIGGVALLTGLIYGGYRLMAPARAKASGIKPFVMLAWVLVALVTFQAWSERSSKAPAAASTSFDPSTAHPVAAPHGFDAANAVIVSPPPATQDFDPTNAVLVEIRP